MILLALTLVSCSAAPQIASVVDLLVSLKKPVATEVQPNLGKIGEVTIGELLERMDDQPSSFVDSPSISECDELLSFIESQGGVDLLQISDIHIIVESGGQSKRYDFSGDDCIERQ